MVKFARAFINIINCCWFAEALKGANRTAVNLMKKFVIVIVIIFYCAYALMPKPLRLSLPPSIVTESRDLWTLTKQASCFQVNR